MGPSATFKVVVCEVRVVCEVMSIHRRINTKTLRYVQGTQSSLIDAAPQRRGRFVFASTWQCSVCNESRSSCGSGVGYQVPRERSLRKFD